MKTALFYFEDHKVIVMISYFFSWLLLLLEYTAIWIFSCVQDQSRVEGVKQTDTGKKLHKNYKLHI